MPKLPEHISAVTISSPESLPLQLTPAPTQIPVREQSKSGVVTHYKAHPLAWAHALQLAEGDMQRLKIQADGSVIVLNPRN